MKLLHSVLCSNGWICSEIRHNDLNTFDATKDNHTFCISEIPGVNKIYVEPMNYNIGFPKNPIALELQSFIDTLIGTA